MHASSVTCTHAHFACTHTRMHAHLHVCTYVCAHTYVHTYACTHVHSCEDTHAHACMYALACTYTQSHLHTHAQLCTHIHISLLSHACTHIAWHSHTCKYAPCMPASHLWALSDSHILCRHTYSNIHIVIRAWTQSRMHTYTYIFILMQKCTNTHARIGTCKDIEDIEYSHYRKHYSCETYYRE